MLAISLTLALFQAPDLAKKVTFTSVAKPVKQILQELSPQAGFPLMTSQVTEDEVLVVRFNDIPVGEAMKRIADATNTEWQEEQGGYRLIRSAARAQQEEREALAKRTEEIRKAIAKKLEKASLEPLTVQKAEQLTNDFMKLKPRSDGMNFDYSLWQQSNRLEQSTASGRLMNRLIGLLNPQEIARIPAGDRVVFSSLPTAMQRRFSGNVRDALAAFAKDHSVWIEAAKRIAGDMWSTKVPSHGPCTTSNRSSKGSKRFSSW